MGFWYIVLNIVVFVLVLGIIVLIHELGHFFVARKVNVLCHEFSIGMGPAIAKKKKGETTYSIRAIPLGGYVSMAGEDINETLIRKDQEISINIDEKGSITEIIFDNAKEGSIKGRIVDFDLYGKDMSPLFIDLDIDEEIVKFDCLRDAKYVFTQKKEMQIAPEERSFESKKIWQRFLVLLAGPGMNFILALILCFIVSGVQGKPEDSNVLGSVSGPSEGLLKAGDTINSIGGYEVKNWSDIGVAISNLNTAHDINVVVNNNQLRTIDLLVGINNIGISNVTQNKNGEIENIYTTDPIVGSVAAEVGKFKLGNNLKAKDLITSISINGLEPIAITSWDDIIFLVKNDKIPDRATIKIFYNRTNEDGTIESLDTGEYEVWGNRELKALGAPAFQMLIGVGPESKFNFGYMFTNGFKQFGNDFVSIFKTLGILVSSNQVGLRNLSGPVGIFNIVGNTMSGGVLAIVSLIAFLSVNIGMINLLPIPALDGGRIVFLGVEKIRRGKKVPPKIENTVNNVFFILLLVMILYVTIMDIFRLF